ncbi:MAG: hypothetical protein ACK47B_23230 [Armatimonadota bacterium]
MQRVWRRTRGASMVIAIVAVAVMALAVTSVLPTSNLRISASEDSVNGALALAAAEAGLNLALHRMGHGFDPPTWSEDAAQGLRAEYPAGSGFGYRVGLVSRDPATGQVVLRARGSGGGLQRTIEITARPVSLFGRFALLGLSTDTSAKRSHSLAFTNAASVTGAVGANGVADCNRDVVVRDGALVLAGSAASLVKAAQPTFSSPNAPALRAWTLPFPLTTAAAAADRSSGGSTGLAYYREHNSNNAATNKGKSGIYWVYQHSSTGETREEPVLMSSSDTPYVLGRSILGGGTITDSTGDSGGGSGKGKKGGGSGGGGGSSSWVFQGTRFYPGHYYFTQVEMRTGDRIFIHNSPVSGSSSRRVVFWIDTAGARDPDSTLTQGVTLSDPSQPGGFRLYMASQGDLELRSDDAGTGDGLHADILHCDRTAEGIGYGAVTVRSGVTLRGSVVAWAVTVENGATVFHTPPTAGDLAGEDQSCVDYRIIAWSEL